MGIKLVLLVMFFIGIIFVIIGYYNSKIFTPRQKIIYKFIDKNMEENIYDSQDVSTQFEDMFA